jgi:hypothetical protein
MLISTVEIRNVNHREGSLPPSLFQQGRILCNDRMMKISIEFIKIPACHEWPATSGSWRWRRRRPRFGSAVQGVERAVQASALALGCFARRASVRALLRKGSRLAAGVPGAASSSRSTLRRHALHEFEINILGESVVELDISQGQLVADSETYGDENRLKSEVSPCSPRAASMRPIHQWRKRVE